MILNFFTMTENISLIYSFHKLIYEKGEIMAQETKQQIIERLENELEKKERLIKILVDQIADKDTILKSNEKLIATQREYIEILKADEDKKAKEHNERGAGRKARFTNAEIETIKMYRLQGKKIKEIAEMFNCSVGLIHKIINEIERMCAK